MVVWGVTDGSAGTMAQVKALAKALSEDPVMKRVLISRPLILLPNDVIGSLFRWLIPHFMHSYDSLEEPWPDVIISCGRRGALASLGIRSLMKKHGKRPCLVHIHDPRLNPKQFDVVLAMAHDHIEAPNVIKTRFALHDITLQTLAEAKEKFARRFVTYPKPYAAVLLGGSTNKYRLTKKRMVQVIDALRHVHDGNQSTLLITPSRRTGFENLQALLKEFPRIRESKAYVYDGIGENPYIGMLGLADHIVVTDDSVNMMSEAVATGKPVHILRLPGHKNTKPSRFADRLIEEGMARPLNGKLESWEYTPSQEMQDIAADIRQRLSL